MPGVCACAYLTSVNQALKAWENTDVNGGEMGGGGGEGRDVEDLFQVHILQVSISWRNAFDAWLEKAWE